MGWEFLGSILQNGSTLQLEPFSPGNIFIMQILQDKMHYNYITISQRSSSWYICYQQSRCLSVRAGELQSQRGGGRE